MATLVWLIGSNLYSTETAQKQQAVYEKCYDRVIAIGGADGIADVADIQAGFEKAYAQTPANDVLVVNIDAHGNFTHEVGHYIRLNAREDGAQVTTDIFKLLTTAQMGSQFQQRLSIYLSSCFGGSVDSVLDGGLWLRPDSYVVTLSGYNDVSLIGRELAKNYPLPSNASPLDLLIAHLLCRDTPLGTHDIFDGTPEIIFGDGTRYDLAANMLDAERQPITAQQKQAVAEAITRVLCKKEAAQMVGYWRMAHDELLCMLNTDYGTGCDAGVFPKGSTILDENMRPVEHVSAFLQREQAQTDALMAHMQNALEEYLLAGIPLEIGIPWPNMLKTMQRSNVQYRKENGIPLIRFLEMQDSTKSVTDLSPHIHPGTIVHARLAQSYHPSFNPHQNFESIWKRFEKIKNIDTKQLYIKIADAMDTYENEVECAQNTPSKDTKQKIAKMQQNLSRYSATTQYLMASLKERGYPGNGSTDIPAPSPAVMRRVLLAQFSDPNLAAVVQLHLDDIKTRIISHIDRYNPALVQHQITGQHGNDSL